ncbi:MAG TPA: DUF3014 domain-containing protein [Crenotrichaceae bacterium]|nr:DUF3014 domain-containing protein [Crenotrichaceae bacterium]
MDNKQAQYPKKQHVDTVVVIVVLLCIAILAYLAWLHFQSTATDDLIGTEQSLDNKEIVPQTGDTGNDDHLKRQQETLRLDKQSKQLTQNTSKFKDESGHSNDIAESHLPELDKSDAFVRQSISNLSDTAVWKGWLKTAQPVRKFTQFMENVARGKVPHKYFQFMAPSGSFEVITDADDQYQLDPAGYKRYDMIAQCIDSLDAATVVRVYTTLEPLVNSAWAEIKPDQSTETRHAFDQVLLSAIQKIRSAPAITDRISLIRPSVMYKYADPKLEHLNAVSKQMLRMGPRNTRIIQKKLDEVEKVFLARHQQETSIEQTSTPIADSIKQR